MLTENIKQYDAVISDVYGVVHDGVNILGNAVNTLNEINKHQNLIFLSNAPRVKSIVEEKLFMLGLKNFQCETSGEIFYEDLKSGYLANQNIEGSYFFIGKEEDRFDLHGIKNYSIADTIKKADFILISGILKEHNTELFTEIINSQKPIVCINPDLIVNSNNKKILCGGIIGKIAESAGCDVLYYGKPYKRVYDYIIKKYNIETSSCIAIGDSMITDIQGAFENKIHSILTKCGVHKHQFDKDSTGKFLKKYNFQPTFIVESL